MDQKNITIGLVLLALLVASYFFLPGQIPSKNQQGNIEDIEKLDPTPRNATISGTYTCLPHLNTRGPQTMECAFGIKTDQGDYYAVNFGQSAESMDLFQSGARVTLEGFIVIKEALSTDQWQKYNMKGIFTVTRVVDSKTNPNTSSGKININVVCEGALAYMTFTSGAAADQFVKECKEGKYPEVIEQYKVQMGLGDGAAI